MATATLPITECVTNSDSRGDVPYTVVSRGPVDELEFNSKVVIARGTFGKRLGYRVGILGEQTEFHGDLELAIRRVIYLLGLEGRDILVFDTIPGVHTCEEAPPAESFDDEGDWNHGYHAA